MAKELDRMSLRELQELELKVRKARANVHERRGQTCARKWKP